MKQKKIILYTMEATLWFTRNRIKVNPGLLFMPTGVCVCVCESVCVCVCACAYVYVYMLVRVCTYGWRKILFSS